eukprot:scaffold4825_cov132-Cylindrotheca_fusiformis.AAC.10
MLKKILSQSIVSLEQRLDQHPTRQKAWISSARSMIDKATQQAAIPSPGNSDIRSFLATIPPRGLQQGHPPGHPSYFFIALHLVRWFPLPTVYKRFRGLSIWLLNLDAINAP